MEKLERDGRLDPEAASSPLQQESLIHLNITRKSGWTPQRRRRGSGALCRNASVTRDFQRKPVSFRRTLFDDSISYMAIDNEPTRHTFAELHR